MPTAMPDGSSPEPGGWNRIRSRSMTLRRRCMSWSITAVPQRRHHRHGGKQAIADDPSGNPIELFQPARSTGAMAPGGCSVLTPFLTVNEVASLALFVTDAFGGTTRYAMTSADGIVRHARLDVGGSQLIVSSGVKEFPPMPCMLHLYVEDVDSTYVAVLAAGARPLQEPSRPVLRRSGCRRRGPVG